MRFGVDCNWKNDVGFHRMGVNEYNISRFVNYGLMCISTDVFSPTAVSGVIMHARIHYIHCSYLSLLLAGYLALLLIGHSFVACLLIYITFVIVGL